MDKYFDLKGEGVMKIFEVARKGGGQEIFVCAAIYMKVRL